MIDAAVFYIAPERVDANAVPRKRFTGFSFFVLALAEALHERLHASADRLAAEAEQRKAVQLEIRRHPVRIGRANLVEMHDSDITSGIITLKDGRNETQEQGHGRGDEDNTRQPPAQNAAILCILLPHANALDEPVGKVLRQTNVHAPAEDVGTKQTPAGNSIMASFSRNANRFGD